MADETNQEMGQETAAPAGDQGDVEKNKGMAVLSYIGILCLIPLLAAKESKFAQFHAKQGLVLFLAEVLLGILYAIPFLNVVMLFVGWILYILLLVLAIMGIVNALGGKFWKMPVLGGMAEKFKF
ncbi:MAG: hypothetical protein CEN92_280 [Candidatus Berkelbacteria bacterium Licking1014_96]|uniref:DUF4870 domain-containing protein n=1 Tax=Candidatus Berkelbacteria bacterium Licking1014_96 TaxID=2017149 RepID=A0A554LF64_9BACT|nr:MAG: hypothetical protein CEN92_280 [Candidatus Berkelbacteria bacterium Licking1014_96]